MSAQYKIAVRVTPAQSKRWQEIAFNFGFAWGGSRGATVQYVTDPWLVFHPFAKRIKWSHSMLYSGSPLPQHQYSAETDAYKIMDWFKQTTGEQKMYMVVRVELPYNEELQKIAISAGWRWPHNLGMGDVYSVPAGTKALIFANPDKYEPQKGKVIRWSGNGIPSPEATAVFSYPEHAEYIRKALGAEKQKAEPVSNIMSKNIVSIYVNGYPELNAAVQQMAFKNGWTWNNGSTAVETKESHYLVADVDRRKLFWEMWQVSTTVLDARKQFDEVAKLLSAKPVNSMQRFIDAQAAGKYVTYVKSITDITLDHNDVRAALEGRRSDNNFGCGEGHYVIIGEDIPMPPTQAVLGSHKYELTYEVRAPKNGEYFVNKNGRHIEQKTTSPLYSFNGLRWIVKAKAPSYVPHTRETAKVGVEVWDTTSEAKALVTAAGLYEVRIGATLYSYSEACTQFRMADKVTPYGVKQ